MWIGSMVSYIKDRKRSAFIFLLFSAVFSLIFFLYGFPMEAVLYPFAICIFLGLFFWLMDFLRYLKKKERLLLLRREVGVTLEHLPSAECQMELLYQELLKELFRQKQECMDGNRGKYQELMEYYTIWAHQIKTPIAAMGLILQREDTKLTVEVRQELRRIEQYVEMVLAVLRLDSDTTDYVIREYELDDLIRQAVRKYAQQFIYRKIRLVYEPVGVKAVTDEKWLVFVLEQLLSNALKYTKSGSITISLEEPKTLCIRDTGIGIAPEDLPRIFEKGYTGYNGRSDKRASGIGLYLCRRILERLGHALTAESVPGQGTAIRIDFRQQELTVE